MSFKALFHGLIYSIAIMAGVVLGLMALDVMVYWFIYYPGYFFLGMFAILVGVGGVIGFNYGVDRYTQKFIENGKQNAQ